MTVRNGGILAKIFGSQDLRYGGMTNMGPDPRHMGGFSAFMAAGWVAGVGWLLGKLGVLAVLGITVPPLGALLGLAVKATAVGYLLYEAAHWLDNLDRVLPSRLRS